MLQVTTGWAAPETIDTTERVAALAEKSGNLMQLFGCRYKGCDRQYLGRLTRRWSVCRPATRSRRSRKQSHESRGRTLPAIDNSLLAWRPCRRREALYSRVRFFVDPGFRRFPGAAARARPDSSAPRFTSSGNGPLWAFGTASYNAWTLGRADLARERMDQMIAAAECSRPARPSDIRGYAPHNFGVT